MKKKKAGFTLMETIMVMLLTVMVMAAIHTVFLSGLKVYSDTNIKSDLQREGQDVQQEISNRFMGAQCIKEINTKDYGKIEFDDNGKSDDLSSIENKWIELDSITVKTAKLSEEDDDESDGVKHINYQLKVEDEKLVLSGGEISSGRVLTSSLYKKIKDEDEDKGKVLIKISNNNSVQFKVNLRKSEKITDEENSISVDVLFRNNDIS